MAISFSNFDFILAQTYALIRIAIWIIIVVGGIGLAWFFMNYKYIVELNTKTGSGIMIKSLRARMKDENGQKVLKPLMWKKAYKFPDDPASIYKKGMSTFIRYYIPDTLNAYPIVLQNSPYLMPVPQQKESAWWSGENSVPRKD